MIYLVIIVLGLALVLTGFLLGFRLGGEHWRDELTEVRVEAARAGRQMHDLTRDAFIAMAERVEGRRHR